MSVHSQERTDKDSPTLRCVSEPEGMLTRNEKSHFLAITEKLQSTLELGPLLNLFLEYANGLIRVDGISFQNEENKIDLCFSRQAAHSCGYRLIIGDEKLGELMFKRVNKFNERELEVLEKLLSLLVRPLRNALKYKIAVASAVTDPSTGAGNRRNLENTLNREMGLAKRHNQSLSIVLFMAADVNASTEKIHQILVSRTQEICRDTDMVFNLDGARFLLLLNQTDASQSRIITDRLVNELNVQIGIATLTGTDSISSLIERATNNMKSREENQLNCAAHG